MRITLIALAVLLLSGYYLYTHQEPETFTVVSYGDTVQDSKTTNIHSNMDLIYILSILIISIIALILYNRKPRQSAPEW